MAVIDFAGFRDLTSAIGGVDVYIPEDVYDSQQDQQWNEGWVHLEDELALKYVRMRYGLLEGDFDRVARQQNFMRAVMRKVLADGTVGNPLKFTNTVESITRNVTVDEGWTNGDLRDLALSMRGLQGREGEKKVRFVTLPFDRYATIPDVGSVNIIDAERSRELWQAVVDDRLNAYLEEHPEDELAEPRQVS